MTRAPMRNATNEITTSPQVFLALDSREVTTELDCRFSSNGCRCVEVASLDRLKDLLELEPPAFIVLSLELNGECVLEFFRKHRLLFGEIPVAFHAGDVARCFEDALAAIRMGAVDVIASPVSYEKLEQISQLAHDQYRRSRAEGSSKGPDVASFLLHCEETTIEANQRVASSYASVSASKEPMGTGFSPNEVVGSTSGDATYRPQVTSENGNVRLSDEFRTQAAVRNQQQREKIQELETWILGSSPAMQSVRSIIAEVAETKANVMIYGASGTGKELVATAVHKLSNRSTGRFEPVNMTEIPHDLAESLLFGHEKGAFTGAEVRQIGVCEAADGGTLFLDEIGEMAMATQPKLLRFLQEGTVRRIGSQTNKKVDVRVITATNRAPETIVKEGRLREDLFFRLHVVPIFIPPLQDRPEDIEQLAMLFLNRYVKAYKRSVEGFTRDALDVFRLHDWPGNVRQLENVVERLVVFAKGRLIDVPDIPAEIHAASMFGDAPKSVYPTESGGVLVNSTPYTVDGQISEAANAVASMSAMQRTERAAIIEALQRCDGHVIDAAHLLGLGQATVYRKIKQYHIPHQRRRRRRSPK